MPESLGNDDLILTAEVCDACQRYFGKEVELYVLDKTPLVFWRVFSPDLNEKRTSASSRDGATAREQRFDPRAAPSPRRPRFTAHEDGSISVDIDDDEIVRGILDGTRTDFKLVLSPKKLHMLGRFLGKVGLGIFATSDPVQARSAI